MPPRVPSLRVLSLGGLLLGLAPAAWSSTSTETAATLSRQFETLIRPFVERHCLECHDREEPEAEFDLSPYRQVSAVVEGFSYWELALERLEAGDMPPKKAQRHPDAAEREAVIHWIRALRAHEAAKMAGDPGPVLARRLNHAEYDHSIRDLTGADLRPTREFPVDPANQAGFDNSGEALAMSPALLKKYLQAAREVAEHLVLKPEGLEFAPHPVVADTDRDKWGVLRIVEFYQRQPTDLARYFAAAWRHQHRAALGHPDATLAETAAAAQVSASYLSRLWDALHAPEDVGPLAEVQRQWRALPLPAEPEVETRVRSGTEELRNFVTTLRAKLVPEVKNLTAPGIQNGSQTLVLWKNRRMAENRRRYDPGALTSADVVAAELEPRAALPNAAVSAVSAASASASAAVSVAAPPRPPSTPDIIRRGGTFLAPAILTTGSSATAQMAANRQRGGDPHLVVPAHPGERARHEAAFARFADLFPDAFYITERARVYLDAEKEQNNAGRLLSAGLHSMTGYFRDDQPLYDLVLDDAGRRELDRLWQEFEYVSSVPVRMHTSFVWFERTDSSYLRDPEFDGFRPEDKSVSDQPRIRALGELYLAKAQRTGASDVAQAAIREHFDRVAAAIGELERQRQAAEPSHLAAIEAFAARAYRRPLTPGDRADLRAFYRHARDVNGVDHEEAMRDVVVRILMSPHFLYRIDLLADTPAPPSDASAAPFARAELSDHALASRLSYFLWASMPDEPLLAAAAAGRLRDPEELRAQARRLLRDPRARRFVTEFAGHWLDFRRFEEHNSVDRERFPAFDAELRTAMFEEPIRFLLDVIQHDRSVLECLHARHTFVNGPLARHYGLPHPAGAAAGPADWIRVDDAAAQGRGGLLPMAVFLTANSPGLRTSPVKRGYWVVRRVLGERIPPPPAEVPEIPNDEAKLDGLTVRQALVRHREDPSCASCHARFDSFGLVFENYGPVGERRTHDFAGQPVDLRADFPGGAEYEGLVGLQRYLRTHREHDFTDTLARKLLAFALNRTLLLSDDALIAEMTTALAADGYRFSTLVEKIVSSPQFRTKRVPTLASVPPPER